MLVRPIAQALALERGERVIAIVNGLGSTHPLELSVMFLETARAARAASAIRALARRSSART